MKPLLIQHCRSYRRYLVDKIKVSDHYKCTVKLSIYPCVYNVYIWLPRCFWSSSSGMPPYCFFSFFNADEAHEFNKVKVKVKFTPLWRGGGHIGPQVVVYIFVKDTAILFLQHP